MYEMPMVSVWPSRNRVVFPAVEETCLQSRRSTSKIRSSYAGAYSLKIYVDSTAKELASAVGEALILLLDLQSIQRFYLTRSDMSVSWVSLIRYQDG